MKNGLLFASALVAFVFVSCKKDYTCHCTDSSGATIIDYTAKLKKKDANAWCDSWNSTVSAGGSGDKCELQ
ncbi:MAG TPA: hypothetical protein VD905_11055 [Flavobacteriales bacterium]|nr:hypothetical protein [Flavobacteriales bacterium]